MRRPAALLSVLVVALLLGGCSLMPRRDVLDPEPLSGPSVEASASLAGPPASSSAVTRTVLASGSKVRMASGLILTVPKGWTGTLTRDDDSTPDVSGALGARDASELLVLQQARPRGHKVRVSSSPDAEARWLEKTAYRPVLASSEATAFEVAFGPSGSAPPLAVVRTHAPGSAYGLVVFVHTAGSTAQSVKAVWRLFRIKGVAPPLLSALGP